MPRTLIALITFMLAAPVLAFIAAGAAAGMDSGIYTGALGFLVGVLFLAGFAHEIQRLASAPSENLIHGWMSKPSALSDTPAALVQDETERTRVEVLRDGPSRAMTGAPVQHLQAAKAA